MAEKEKFTFAHLKAELDKLTPEQLAHEARWLGDERGGKIQGLWTMDEDMVNPSGDGMEPLSLLKENYPDEGWEDEEIVAVKGQPFVAVD